jgi:hypothetical protein
VYITCSVCNTHFLIERLDTKRETTLLAGQYTHTILKLREDNMVGENGETAHISGFVVKVTIVEHLPVVLDTLH